MGLLNGVGIGAVRGLLGGRSVSGALKPFRDILRAKDFFSADFSVTAGKWVPIGEYEIGAQQIVNVGYGNDVKPENAGYIYAKLSNAAGTAINGKFRIIAQDANDIGKDTIFNEDLDSLGGDANDKSKMIMLQEHPTEVLHNEKVVLQVYSDTTDTVDFDHADTKLKVPVTRRYTKQK